MCAVCIKKFKQHSGWQIEFVIVVEASQSISGLNKPPQCLKIYFKDKLSVLSLLKNWTLKSVGKGLLPTVDDGNGIF